MGPEERFRDGMGICLVAIARNLFFFYRPTMGLECVNGGSWTRMMSVIEVDDAGREWAGCRFVSISRNEKKRENLIARKFGKRAKSRSGCKLACHCIRCNAYTLVNSIDKYVRIYSFCLMVLWHDCENLMRMERTSVTTTRETNCI